MKRLTIYCLTCLIGVSPLFAQQGVTQCGTPTGQPKFPIETYQELPDPSSPSDKDWAAVTAPQISWGTIDTRYAKHRLPQLKKQQLTTLKGWRGERVNAQAVVWTGTCLLYTSGVSIYKSCFNGRLDCTVEGNDLFHTVRDATTQYDNKVKIYRETQRNTQEVKLTVHYKFNLQKSKYKGTGAGLDEQQRL